MYIHWKKIKLQHPDCPLIYSKHAVHIFELHINMCTGSKIMGISTVLTSHINTL